MPNPSRKLAFIIASTDHGTFIVNRFDQMMVSGDAGYGVGLQLLENAHYDPEEVNLLLRALDLRRQCYGDGVVAIDCGANVGVHTDRMGETHDHLGRRAGDRSPGAHPLCAGRQYRDQQLLQRPRHSPRCRSARAR